MNFCRHPKCLNHNGNSQNNQTFNLSMFKLFSWCSDAKDVVVLENVEYGTKGPFTINVWMKKDISTDLYGASHQYIFSHTSLAIANAPQLSPSEPNQVGSGYL